MRGAPGVNVVGPFEAELGNGETARTLVGALDAAGVPCLPVGFVASASRQGHAFAHVVEPDALFPQTVLCVNADQTPRFHERLGPRWFDGRRTIGLWWWEVSELPDWLRASFAFVDEVWTGSAWTADVLRAASPGPPVHHVRLPARIPAPGAATRAELGLPDTAPVVLFAFDHNSVLARKNPLGAIEAFVRAVGDPRPGGPVLVLKSINGDRHPRDHHAVLDAAGGRPDVLVRDGYLDVQQRDALLDACDVYLSLHRAEGFGLTLAEALALGKPVVATGWSGSDEVIDERWAWPVDVTLVAVGAGNDPYPADAQWAEPDVEHAARQLRTVLGDLRAARAKAAAGQDHVLRTFTPEACAAGIVARLREGGPSWAHRLRREDRRARSAAAELRRRRG